MLFLNKKRFFKNIFAVSLQFRRRKGSYFFLTTQKILE